MLSWTLPHPQASDDFFEGFEDGIPADWALIDADGDNHWWYLASVLMPPPSFSFFPHSGEDMISSESFSNMVGVGPLHPDNYIVTPLLHVTEGSVFSFWACAQDRNYPAEHFGVAVSTGSQTDADDFVTIQEWTLTAKDGRQHGEWYQYSVDLSAYAGQAIYVAIRHFNCYDNFYLNVDDVEFTTGSKAAAPSGELVGTFIFLDGEFLTYVLENTETFIHRDQPEVEHEYALRIVYDGDFEDFSFSSMSCEEYVIMDNPTMVTEVTGNSVMVYPNPTTDAVTLCCKGMQYVKVFNSVGQMVQSAEVDGDEAVLDVSVCVPGLYVIQIMCRDAKIMSQQVAISR